MLHFLYVRPPLGQFVAPDWAPPLNDTKAQKTLLRAYQRVLVGARGAEWFARRAEEEDVGFKGANAGGGDAAGGRRRGAARIRGREYGATAVEEDLLSVVLRRTGI